MNDKVLPAWEKIEIRDHIAHADIANYSELHLTSDWDGKVLHNFGVQWEANPKAPKLCLTTLQFLETAPSGLILWDSKEPECIVICDYKLRVKAYDALRQWYEFELIETPES